MGEKRELSTGDICDVEKTLFEKAYTEHEFNQLLTCANDSRYSHHAKQNYVIVALGGWCGVRVGELLGIEPEDFITDDSGWWFLKIISLKKRGFVGRPRIVPINDNILPMLKLYLKECPPGKPIIRRYHKGKMTGGRLHPSNVRRRMESVCRRAGVPWKKYHGLRHRFGSFFAGKFEIIELAALMGHVSTNTTQIYYHQNPAVIREKYDNAMSAADFKKRFSPILN